jgi:NitT/TauT family transport system substrate-binding protein
MIFMVTDTSSGADGIVARPEIRAVADLADKSVAVAKGAPSHFFLYALSKKNSVDLRRVKLVFFDDPTLAGQAFASGNVDAAVTWEPLLSQIVGKQQGHLLASSADTPDTIVDVLVGSSKFLADRDRVRKFVDGWQRGVNLAKMEQAVAFPIIAKSLGMPAPASGENVLAGITLADRPMNRRILCPPSGRPAPADAVIGDAQAFWISQGLVPSVKPKPDELIDRLICQ